VDRFVQGST